MEVIASLAPQFGSLIWTLVAFVVALSIIVAIHEYGHYIVGRWSGIRAEVFSIGFGPVIWARTDRRGTRWQIAALPFGGYVKFLGDANAASAGADGAAMARLDADERRHTMHGAPLWARAATVAAGPVFNFILSAVLFAAVMLVAGRATDAPEIGTLSALPGETVTLRPGDRILSVEGIDTPDYAALNLAAEALKDRATLTYRVERDGTETEAQGPQILPPRVAQVVPDSAAAAAGLRAGDVVTAIDGQPIASFAQMQDIVEGSEGRALVLGLWRDGQPVEATLSPRRTDLPLRDGGFETSYKMGIAGELFFTPVTEAVGPFEAVRAGTAEVAFVVRSSLSALTHMVSGAISTCNLRGPIGIAETSGQAASAGLSNFVWFLAVLSTAVGMMNLFPIPVLDGGHLVFHAWEAIRGKPPSERAMGVLMTCGFAIVLALMAFGLTNDLRC
ncbi:RIP metalloprotease RseP [Frigidibacter sp. MR17.24]|uniref:RIP metalloprotease RseP n=1 Tax=Frigidibacter sp. MR17.24 TaxID=3127345 RepID=UPI003012D81C